MTNQKTVTRFAPSPTGFLHIGGARTALFCYYYAKRHGGEFRLRIEDTDKKRSTSEATQAILTGMDWLGLSHDGDVIYQSQNKDRHIEAARELLASGHAYKCYMSEAEASAERERSREEGRALRSPYRDGRAGDGDYVVRFKVPDGETVIEDAVMGSVRWDNKDFDDLVLLRANGSPVYMLAVVVDDYDMGITHIVRGDDHLTNAGRQKLIIEALGWNVPVYAHVPLIFGPDGKKLSKRHGALGVMAYQELGYVPAGMRNYLTRLGWAHGDMEIFGDTDVLKVFDLDGINKSPARLDFEKMAHINGHHLRALPKSELLAAARPFLDAVNDGPLNLAQSARISKAASHLAARSDTLTDFAAQAAYLLAARPLSITGKSKKSLRPDAKKRLGDLQLLLKAVKETDWQAENLLSLLNTYIEKEDIGFGKIGPPLRSCLTAGAPSGDLALVLEFLGKDETIGRVSDALDAYFE